MSLLDQIDSRIHSAAEVMLPALRQALHGFTRRADILLRQLSFSEGAQHALLEAFSELAHLPEEDQNARFSRAAEHLTVLHVGFIDPDHLRLYNTARKRRVETRAEAEVADDPETRRRLFVERALERAFAVNNRQIYEYVVNALAGGHEIRSTMLPMRDAHELLFAAHVIEVGAATAADAGFRFDVRETGNRTHNEYFDGTDEFIIRVVAEEHRASE
jgi:hypothetical protein